MKFDREGVLFKSGDGLYWPFPRLRFRLRNGYWCPHRWMPSSEGRTGGWNRIDYQIGRKMRRCGDCTYAEFE